MAKSQESGEPPLPLPTTDSGADVPGPVFGPPGQAGQGPSQPSGPIFEPEPGEPPNPMADNAPGYVPEGQGIDELDPDGDGALRPGRVATVMEHRDERTSAGDGGFKLDPEAMRAMLPRWQGVRDKLDELKRDADNFRWVMPPADDDASWQQVNATYEHHKVYASIIEQQHEYAKEYVGALERAIQQYEEGDRTAGDAARGVGQNL